MSGLLVDRGGRIQTAHEFNATTSYINFGATTGLQRTLAQTVLTLSFPKGSGESGFGYVFAIGPSGQGPKLFYYHPDYTIQFSGNSTGSTTNPTINTPNNSIVANRWTWMAGSWDGSLNASGIKIYSTTLGIQQPLVLRGAGSVSNNGLTAADGAYGQDMYIGNRTGTDRTFNGTIALVARWNRVLTIDELRRAQRFGPLSVRKGLIFCWANGRDHGPQHLRPTAMAAVPVVRGPN